jgi:hypothetical protein
VNIQEQKEIIYVWIQNYEFMHLEFSSDAEPISKLFQGRVLCDDKPLAALCPTCGVLASTTETCPCGAKTWQLFRLAEVEK